MKWVLSSLILHIPRQLFLIPLGPGETKQITHDSIDRSYARFLPDGKNVVFSGTERVTNRASTCKPSIRELHARFLPRE
jgi:hypothetical protein